MSTEITVLNSKFESKGKFNSPIELSPEEVSLPSLHLVVKSLLAGRRQGNAATKTKGFVSGGGIKPFKQKGTGRARQGSTRSPLMPGGGTIFGPIPRDYTQKVNKKTMKRAILSVVVDKFQSGKLLVVDKIESTGKTKDMYKLLSGKGLLSSLVVTEKDDSPAIRATRNIAKAKALPVGGFSVYEALKYENLIVEKAALEALLNRVGDLCKA